MNTDTSVGVVLTNDVDAIDHTIDLATIDSVDLSGLRSLDSINATDCIGLLDVENVYVVETNDILTVAVMVTEQEYDLLAHVVSHVDFAILPTIHSSSLFGESLAANRIGESHLLDVEASLSVVLSNVEAIVLGPTGWAEGCYVVRECCTTILRHGDDWRKGPVVGLDSTEVVAVRDGSKALAAAVAVLGTIAPEVRAQVPGLAVAIRIGCGPTSCIVLEVAKQDEAFGSRADKVYVTFQSINEWGWNGQLF